MNEYTLAIIKPNAFEKHTVGKIFERLLESGLEIRTAQSRRWNRHCAQLFYSEHKDKPFYRDLVDFMSSGPCLAVVLYGPDAISKLRALIGPAVGAPAGTIRGDFGDPSVTYRNAIHASDSPESAAREIELALEVYDEN